MSDEELLEIIDFIEPRYNRLGYEIKFDTAFQVYQDMPDFDLNQNIHEVSATGIEEVQAIVRLATQFYLTKTFKAMKINLDDPNTMEDLSVGNIGTPGRLAKMWVGSDLSDATELLSGRWTKPPRMASFPNTNHKNLPITKRVDLVSCCSHHVAPFSTFFREDAYAIISYIPSGKVLGISKLQRTVDWVARRGWLQEDLTKKIYEEVAVAAETTSVYVKLVNVSHTCESLRGSQTQDGAFTTEYYSGKFDNPEIRKEIV